EPRSGDRHVHAPVVPVHRLERAVVQPQLVRRRKVPRRRDLKGHDALRDPRPDTPGLTLFFALTHTTIRPHAALLSGYRHVYGRGSRPRRRSGLPPTALRPS